MIITWCELRGDYRTFRTDRVAAALELDETYPGRRSDWLRGWRKRMQSEEAKRFTPDKK